MKVDLDALKALLAAATQGKWDWGEPWAGFCTFTVDGKTVIYTATADCPNPENDHKFMAAMADAAPDLIAEVEAAREALKAAKAALAEVKGCFEAAQVEGLTERLAEADSNGPGSLAELVANRLMYSIAPTDEAIAAIAAYEDKHHG
jgi:hypothetical protein